jgi:hypothetical protein
MVDIQSKEAIDKISEELKVQPAMDIPRELAKQIQLTYDIGGGVDQWVAKFKDSSGVIYTGTAGKRLFLVAISLSSVSHNANTTSKDTVAAQLKGTTSSTKICNVTNGSQAATTNTASNTVVFPKPIELESGTAISLSLGSTAGQASIVGFELNPQ